jgi:hypothetical protein
MRNPVSFFLTAFIALVATAVSAQDLTSGEFITMGGQSFLRSIFLGLKKRGKLMQLRYKIRQKGEATDFINGLLQRGFSINHQIVSAPGSPPFKQYIRDKLSIDYQEMKGRDGLQYYIFSIDKKL